MARTRPCSGCRSMAWATSWASTPATSSGVCAAWISPSISTTRPPGAAKALIMSLGSTSTLMGKGAPAALVRGSAMARSAARPAGSAQKALPPAMFSTTPAPSFSSQE